MDNMIEDKIKKVLKERPMTLIEIQKALPDVNSGNVHIALNSNEIYSGKAELLRRKEVIEKDGMYYLNGG